MNKILHLVCPHCQAINRVPAERLTHAPNCGQCHQALFTDHPVELDASSLEQHLKHNDIPLLVDFWAPWCGPCKMMAPQFVQAASLLAPQMRLAKVNTEAHPTLGRLYDIRSIPTLVLFRGGHELARQAGAMRAQEIMHWVRTYVS